MLCLQVLAVGGRLIAWGGQNAYPANQETTMTARSILENRLGRPLGPIAAMPRDLRVAMYRLALQLVKNRLQA